MDSSSLLLEIISGRRRGVLPAFCRAGLSLLTIPYGGVARLRNLAFDLGLLRTRHARAPVICVGNLTVGGTGKTPLIAWLAEWLVAAGHRPAIVARGYQAQGQTNDEAQQLAQQLPDVPQIQSRDRVSAANRAIAEHQANVILMDDGLQHRWLVRDLNIVLVDALCPFGYGHLLPRGLLREPISGLRRADVVLCTRADLISSDELNSVRSVVRRFAPSALWGEVVFRPTGLLNSAGERSSLEALRGKRLAAFCGIGNPAGFRELLARQSIDPVLWQAFPDHHHYSAAEVLDLGRRAAQAGASMLLCTHKDLVKVGQFPGELPLAALTLTTEIRAGQQELAERLRAILK